MFFFVSSMHASGVACGVSNANQPSNPDFLMAGQAFDDRQGGEAVVLALTGSRSYFPGSKANRDFTEIATPTAGWTS